MKKLEKLVLHQQKLIKNEDLIKLRGGGYDMCCYFYDELGLITCGPTESCVYCENWAPEGTIHTSCNTCTACG